MTEKRKLLTIVGVSIAVALGFGGLIYYQHGELEKDRAKAEQLRAEIEQGRTLIATTADLEKKVITHRETESVVAELLPGSEDINNFVRTLREFEETAGIKIVGLKEKTINEREQLEFDRVAYTLTFDGDAFGLLSFLNEIEGHSRFMSVTSFKLSAARAQRGEIEEEPRHKVTMDVETYVYEPKGGSEVLEIEGYDRKRDLLMAEITRRRAELRIKGYDYRGPRGRRDPWIDPRVPVGDGDELVLSIEQQIALVDELVESTRSVWTKWNEVTEAPNLIAKMKARADFDHELALLEESVRRVNDEAQLVFIPAERRFHTEVIQSLEDLRMEVTGDRAGIGPSVAELEETLDVMERHFELGEFELALQAYGIHETALDAVERDTIRGPLARQLHDKAEVARAVLEFNDISLAINGVALQEGLPPVAIINGRTVAVGEMLPESTVVVQAIHRDEIEFGFRGLTLVRRIEQ